MTALLAYTLHCDADGCTATFGAAEDRAYVTRRIAAKDDWLHVVVTTKRNGPTPSLDYCPVHREVPYAIYPLTSISVPEIPK
jgi:hypothetical protein